MAEASSRGTTSEEINRLIRQHAKPGAKIHLEDVRGHRAVGVGLSVRVGVVIDGEAGDFLAAFNAGGLFGARSSVGNYAGYGMTAGSLGITGRAGDATAAFLQGGSVRAFSDVGAAAGWGMRGGDLTVKGDAGEGVGAAMAGGEIAVLGRTAGPVGTGMGGGALYVLHGTLFDATTCRASPLDTAGEARLRQLASGVKVTDLEVASYVKVTSAMGGGAPGTGPGGPAQGARVRVVPPPRPEGAPRVRVSVSSDADKGADPP